MNKEQIDSIIKAKLVASGAVDLLNAFQTPITVVELGIIGMEKCDKLNEEQTYKLAVFMNKCNKLGYSELYVDAVNMSPNPDIMMKMVDSAENLLNLKGISDNIPAPNSDTLH